MTQQIITRAEAKARGLKRYFTGKPCPHGHVAERLVNGGAVCVECHRIADTANLAAHQAAINQRRRERYAANPGPARARNAAQRAKRPEKARAAAAAWRAAHPEKARAAGSERKWDPAYREKERIRNAARRRAHPAVKLAQVRARQARQLKQTCNCCAPKQIREIYEMARLVGGEVDHVTPLSEGGEHCTKNLQILSPAEHRKKTALETTFTRPPRATRAP